MPPKLKIETREPPTKAMRACDSCGKQYPVNELGISEGGVWATCVPCAMQALRESLKEDDHADRK